MAAMPRASDPRLVVRLSPELDAALSERVGGRGRAAFARWALEAALGLEAGVEVSLAAAGPDASAGAGRGVGSTPAVPASPRAPEGVASGSQPSRAKDPESLTDAPSGARKPSAVQLANRKGLPIATCQRALDDGTWEKL